MNSIFYAHAFHGIEIRGIKVESKKPHRRSGSGVQQKSVNN